MQSRNILLVGVAAVAALVTGGCGSSIAPTAASLVADNLVVQSSLSTGEVGSPYAGAAVAQGGTPAYTWSVSAGNLPAGIALAPATGQISGIPMATGTANFALTVTDSSTARQQMTQNFKITIAAGPSPVIIKTATLPAANTGVTYAATLQAAGGTAAYTWSIAKGSLPSGLSLDTSAGILSGVPAIKGTYTFTVAVADSTRPNAETQTAALSVTVADAPAHTTWYVRADGGTRYSSNVPAGQCDGQGDAAYPGTGVNQHCAFNDIRLLWQDGSYAYNPPDSTFPAAGWVGQGGDTYILRGSIAAGSASYRVGWSSYDGNGADPALVAAGNPAPYRGWRGNQYAGPPTPPAGTAGAHTRILGENWQSCHAQSARTPVVAGFHVGSAFNFSSSYIDFQCVDISDKSDCISSCEKEDFGVEGIGLSNAADHLTLTDVRIHGMKTFGMLGPSGDGSVFSYLSLVGNGGGGWNADAGDGTTGTGSLLVQHYEIKWNGCAEEYPIKDPLPYINCTDQSSGGYGDGFGTAAVPSKPGWQAHFDQGEVAYNTQDGLDALHLIGNGSSMTVTRTLAYGNMGQQIKVGGAAGTLQDSVVVGDCNAMAGAIPGTPAGYNAHLSDFCRAGNQALLMTVGNNSTTTMEHNTVMGAGALLIGYVCDGSNGNCDSSALVDLQDNILLGNANPDRGNPGGNYLMVIDNTYTNAAACNAAPDHHHQWITDGSVGCGNDVFYNAGSFNAHNTYTKLKDLCTDHNGTGNLCMSPGLVDEVQPAYGYPNLALSPHGGAAYHAGTVLSTLTRDYSGASFAVPPSIGALEAGSSLTPYKATE